MKIIGSCLMVLMLFASAAFAAIESPRLATAGGRVASIDSSAGALVVKVDGTKGVPHEMTFLVAADSKIVKDGTAVALSDLKTGDKVNVTYHLEDGKNVVVNIGVAVKS
jgi:Cu/Ag efflux protein CusF